mmetsp:Transcript_16805/g.34471  ORF Transcript_16805/g.34471 Transcript_16805/m.34471 type:complete len:213 (+) Transcript_16805:906-1544(+)
MSGPTREVESPDGGGVQEGNGPDEVGTLGGEEGRKVSPHAVTDQVDPGGTIVFGRCAALAAANVGRKDHLLDEGRNLLAPRVDAVPQALFVLRVAVVAVHRPGAALAEVVHTVHGPSLPTSDVVAVEIREELGHEPVLVERPHPESVQDDYGLLVLRLAVPRRAGLLPSDVMSPEIPRFLLYVSERRRKLPAGVGADDRSKGVAQTYSTEAQ